MDIFRRGHDAYGAPIVDGLSWDLLPVVFWAAIAIAVVHAVFKALSRKRGG